MNFEPLEVIARSRREGLEREASIRRTLRAGRVRLAHSPRLYAARLLRVVGRFALSAGDALAAIR